jgi:glyoxylase-like metal-dependent hydrolase (beta-lactamase superfamily II)
VKTVQSTSSKVEVRDVSRGLWIWRASHPGWKPGDDWEPVVTSTFVESGGERLVLDPLAPPEDATEVWKRLDQRPPTVGVVILPDHVRDIDKFVQRYNVRAYGPMFFFRDDIPKTELTPIRPDIVLPGGLVAQYDGRGRAETPLWLPEQRALVFGDALTEREGQLRVWDSPSHEKRVLPALRALLELPFEQVIISHGEPVHSRAAFERALKLPPWEG